MNERLVPLTVEAADILPIIKRFLYAEREIFLRELISNAIDALTKLDAMRLGVDYFADDEPLRVEISVDPISKTISIFDNGIGMSCDEVLRYINQIAFSGAKEFIDRHAKDQVRLIGQFGLGFYSSFMVSKWVEIETRSWRPAEMACRWNCEGSTSTQIEEFPLDRRGTRVTCCLQNDAHEFLNFECIEKVIHRFLDYAPYPIFLEGRQVNVVTAPWHLGRREREELPSQCYYDLYQRLNPDDNRPLGWFHIESDFPVPVRAVLFVPDRPDGSSGNLRLFANRTFISDCCTELLTNWLGFIDGIVDTQDLPLNVARDRFQKDEQVTKLRNHITAKTLDFLKEMLEKRRKDYVRFWEHCGGYLKGGYLNALINAQHSTCTRLEKLILFPSSRKPLTTLNEYLERAPDSTRPVIFYLTNLQEQQSHLELFRSRNREVLYLTDRVDAALVQVLGQTQGSRSFVRIDQVESIEDLQFRIPEPATDSSEHKQTAEAIDWSPLLDLFREVAGTSITKASLASLPSREIPAILSQTEEDVKQDAFNLLLGNNAADTRKWQLIVNTNCPLIQRLGQLGADICGARLPMELVAQIWVNVRLGAGLLEGQSLFEAVSCRHAFLNLIAEQMLSTKSPA